MDTMPWWGKHRGERLADIPLGYLVWLIEQGNLSNNPGLRESILLEIHSRFPCPNDGANTIPRESLKAFLRTWYRAQAWRFHPDRAGDHDMMKLVNETREIFEHWIDTD